MKKSDFETFEGYGKEIGRQDNQLKECTVTGCLVCREDHTKCEQCNKALGYYFIPPTPIEVCHYKDNIPQGWGIDLTAGAENQLKQCLKKPQGCLVCDKNYQACTRCQDYHIPDQNGQINCYDYASILNGYGINQNSPKLEKCQIGDCLVCKDDYRACSQCKKYHIGTTPFKECFQEKNITIGYGIDKGETKLQKCLVDQCLRCESNYRVCTKCTNALYLDWEKRCSDCTLDGTRNDESTMTCHLCHKTCTIL